MSKEKICEWCGKKFTARPGDENRGYGRTCSRSCGASMREAFKKGDSDIDVFPEHHEDYPPYDDMDYQEDY